MLLSTHVERVSVSQMRDFFFIEESVEETNSWAEEVEEAKKEVENDERKGISKPKEESKEGTNKSDVEEGEGRSNCDLKWFTVGEPLRRVRALLDCVADRKDELLFQASNAITGGWTSLEPGWLMGTLEGKEGMNSQRTILRSCLNVILCNS